MKKINFKEYQFVALLSIFLYLFFYFTQGHISRNEGAGWDGFFYFNMVDKDYQAKLPFALRIGMPRLVSYIDFFDSRLNNFIFLQSIIGFLYSIFSWLLLRKIFPKFSYYSILIGWFFMNTSEMSIMRMGFWIPPNTDNLSNLLFLFILLVLISRQFSLLTHSLLMFCIFFMGTIVRENFFINLQSIVKKFFFIII